MAGSSDSPCYLWVGSSDGRGWKVLIWDGAQVEMDRILALIEADKTITTVVVNVSRTNSNTATIDCEKPITTCHLMPFEPTVISGTYDPSSATFRLE